MSANHSDVVTHDVVRVNPLAGTVSAFATGDRWFAHIHASVGRHYYDVSIESSPPSGDDVAATSIAEQADAIRRGGEWLQSAAGRQWVAQVQAALDKARAEAVAS